MRISIPLLLALVSLPAAAYDIRTDSEGDLVRWSRPLQMVLDTRVSALLKEPQAEGAIRAAFETLDAATTHLEFTMTVGEGQALGYVSGTLNQNSILALEDWPYSEDALAVTLVTLNARTNELLDADVAFNVQSHHFRVLVDSPGKQRAFDDVQNTITHELGHVLGLMHNNATEDLVMYPSAPPGELSKRILKADDRDGLLSLYGVVSEEQTAPPGAFGCSASGSSPAFWMLAGLSLLLLMGKRKPAALLAVMVPALALATEPVPAAVTRADDVALVQVERRQSVQHPRNPGLILTELTLSPSECLKGACAGITRVVVAGGRVGDLEQVAVHEPVPSMGQRILVTRTAGQLRVLWVEPDAQVQLINTLRAAGWQGTQGAGSPRSTTTQVPAITP